MKELEKTLIGWKPRQPSARLEQKLFASAKNEPAGFGHWFAPAMACALALGAFTNGEVFRPQLSSNGGANSHLLALTNAHLPLFSMNAQNVRWNLCSTASLAMEVPEKENATTREFRIANTNSSLL